MNTTPTNNPTPLTGHTVSHAQGAAEDRVEAAARAIADYELQGEARTAGDWRIWLPDARAALAAADAVQPAPVTDCGAKHPTNTSVIPCMHPTGHAGGHWSWTGCAGSHFYWDASEPAPVRGDAAGREALEALWDDGNAVGLDGWVGPGRGTEPIDNEAVRARERAVDRLLAAGFVTGETSARPEHVVKAEALREAVAEDFTDDTGLYAPGGPWLLARADRIEAGESDGE